MVVHELIDERADLEGKNTIGVRRVSLKSSNLDEPPIATRTDGVEDEGTLVDRLEPNGERGAPFADSC